MTIFNKESYFFKQDKQTLIQKRNEVKALLRFKGIDNSMFLKAYDFFVANPKQFDGATIVKDLNDIKGLDLAALVHDYRYLVDLPRYKGLKWFKIKTKYDFEYGRNMELLGKGIYHYIRFIALFLSTPFYLIYKLTK